MYYYLLEPNGNRPERLFKRAVHFIHLHGITGEMVTPSSSASLEELVARAASKGYNTIVAVGGDNFIRQVAALLTKSDIAFGAIPVGASEAMHDLLGVKNVEQAVLSLKQRKLIDTSVGVIAPGKVFLIEAEVIAQQPTPVVVESKTFRVEGTFTDLTIERQDTATVRFSDRSKSSSTLKQFAFWLVGRKLPEIGQTVLRAPVLSITTPEPLPILVNGDQFAKTPCKVRVVPNALKFIQARATIDQVKGE